MIAKLNARNMRYKDGGLVPQYRKSKAGNEFAITKDDGFILCIVFFPKTGPIESCGIKFTRNTFLADDVKNGDLFTDCTKEEFERAYTKAIKMIEL